MKKIIPLIILLAVVVSSLALLASCKGEEELVIDRITAEVSENTVYKEGELFSIDTVVITAILNDETEKVIASSNAALIVDTSDLNLDENGKFNNGGTFELKITFLRYEVTVDIEVLSA